MLTRTPQPPLTEHEWYPDRVLVYYDRRGGDGGDFLTNLVRELPILILYSDGTLVTTKRINLPGEDRYEMLMKKLDRQSICQFLNTFDQIGFLDYDPSSYNVIFDKNTPMGMGGPFISVDAWKANGGYFYGLGYFMEAERSQFVDNATKNPPLILPALRDTYNFINQYLNGSFTVYPPERLGVWVYLVSDLEKYGFEFDRSPRGVWPLQNLSLAQMFKTKGSDAEKNLQRYYVLVGGDANTIYQFLGNSFGDRGEIVVEESTLYLVFARPLLPYEKPEISNSLVPTPGATKANTKLACYPSDGILPIPAPDY